MKIGIVGAGLAGATAAALLKSAGHSVEVFEERDHIGGNCFDEWRDGVLVHRYGPHGFHTNNRRVWEFVNRYSGFHPTALKVVANTSMGIIPIPFNDVSASLVGELDRQAIRDLVFRDYSEKHWGVSWDRVPRSISSRLPERRVGSDCRYHLDQWQGTPVNGYTAMFGAMLDGVCCHLDCDVDAWRNYRWDHVIFTGSVDSYFEEAHGSLGYRSLRFRYERQAKRNHFQINECNHRSPWTRSVDHAHWLDQDVRETVVGYEYPCEWERGLVRMYPKPFGANTNRYRKYRAMAEAERNVTFVGRLATYKYLDMDDVIAQVMVKLAGLVGPCLPR